MKTPKKGKEEGVQHPNGAGKIVADEEGEALGNDRPALSKEQRLVKKIIQRLRTRSRPEVRLKRGLRVHFTERWGHIAYNEGGWEEVRDSDTHIQAHQVPRKLHQHGAVIHSHRCGNGRTQGGGKLGERSLNSKSIKSAGIHHVKE